MRIFAVNEDEIPRLIHLGNSECEKFGSQNRIEAGESLVPAQQHRDAGHTQREVGEEMLTPHPEAVAERPTCHHGDAYYGQRSSEQTHGPTCEIENVTKRQTIHRWFGAQQ